MTPEQAAKVLAVAGTFDARLTPPSREDALARAMAWAQALRADMPPDWAQQAVVAHYAEQTIPVMPAHLNVAWKAHRRAEADRAATRAALDAAGGVPMPDEVRALWAQIAGRSDRLDA